MNREALKLARETLRLAVHTYGWSRTGRDGRGNAARYTYGPGKFEGEHWSIVYFYDAVMNGDGVPLYDGETCRGAVLDVDNCEREAFSFERDTVAVVIWHSEQGFESLQELNEKEAHDLR